MSTQHLVLHDPKNIYWRGALIDAHMANALRAQNIVTIPVNSEVFLKNAAAGFFMRDWGSGWPLPPVTPGRTCPLVLYVVPSLQSIHWRAKIIRMTGDNPSGTIRLTTDTAQMGAPHGGFNSTERAAIQIEQLGEPDSEGAWYVRGEGSYSGVMEGYAGFCLWAHGTGVKIVWAAVSQS